MLDESRIGDLLDGGPKPSVPRRKKRLRVWLPILVIAAALGFLIAKGLGNSLVYFRTVDEALAMKATSKLLRCGMTTSAPPRRLPLRSISARAPSVSGDNACRAPGSRRQ